MQKPLFPENVIHYSVRNVRWVGGGLPATQRRKGMAWTVNDRQIPPSCGRFDKLRFVGYNRLLRMIIYYY